MEKKAVLRGIGWRKKMRDECKGCIFAGKGLLHCAGLDLRWALYELKKTIPLLRRTAEEPEPCWMREMEEEQ